MADTQEVKSLVHNILSVDGLSDKVYRKANKIHLGIASLAVLGGLIVFIEMLLNYCGARAINIYIGLILNIVLIFYFTRPKLLPLLYVKKVRFVIAHILLFCTTMSLLLYLVPIKSNPNMVVAFFLFGLAVIYLDCVYGIHSKTYRRLSIILVYTIAIITFIATPSRALYMKWFGFYPLEVIYTSELEEKYSELEILQNKVIDEKKEATIDYYIEKIKAGKTLTDVEEIELEEIKEGLNRGKIPAAIGSVIDIAKIEAEKARLMAEIARLKAAAEETARELSENGNGNSSNELLEIAAPGTFPFKLDPHEKVKRKIFVKENLRFSITSSRADGDFYLILHDRGDQIFHISKYYKTLPEYAGTFSIINGEKETTITLLVY